MAGMPTAVAAPPAASPAAAVCPTAGGLSTTCPWLLGAIMSEFGLQFHSAGGRRASLVAVGCAASTGVRRLSLLLPLPAPAASLPAVLPQSLLSSAAAQTSSSAAGVRAGSSSGNTASKAAAALSSCHKCATPSPAPRASITSMIVTRQASLSAAHSWPCIPTAALLCPSYTDLQTCAECNSTCAWRQIVRMIP